MKYTVQITSGGIILVHTKSHDGRFRHSSNIKFLSGKYERLQCWYY
jgi:hypothetical protein